MKQEISSALVASEHCSVSEPLLLNKFFPVDTGAQLELLFKEYERLERNPIEVSFRDLVSWVYGGSRASHYLHSYPAKLLPQIPHFFLANTLLCPSNGIVLDPFSGSGTVALEAVLSGRTAYYCDVNPFALTLTRSKTTSIPSGIIEAEMTNVRGRYFNGKIVSPPDVVNIEYWYNKETAKNLAKLSAAISEVENMDVRSLLKICFSTITRKLSRANPRFSVPVRLKVDGEPVDIVADTNEVWETFERATAKASNQIAELNDVTSLGKAYHVSSNVLRLAEESGEIRRTKGNADLIITSPPYAGAQKYVRATSLSLGWLEQVRSNELRTIEKVTLGREHLTKLESASLEPTSIKQADEIIHKICEENPTRAAIASVFLKEMRIAAENTMKTLKSNGHAVVIMADNTICGRRFPTSEFVSRLFEEFGGVRVLELRDKIVSRSLQTKRANTSSSISHETIVVFRKV